MFTWSALIIFTLTVFSVGIQATNHWFLSKGRLDISYKLNIVVYALCTVLEVFLALRDPTQLSVILFVPLYLWAIAMSLKGIRRLKEKNAEVV